MKSCLIDYTMKLTGNTGNCTTQGHQCATKSCGIYCNRLHSLYTRDYGEGRQLEFSICLTNVLSQVRQKTGSADPAYSSSRKSGKHTLNVSFTQTLSPRDNPRTYLIFKCCHLSMQFLRSVIS